MDKNALYIHKSQLNWQTIAQGLPPNAPALHCYELLSQYCYAYSKPISELNEFLSSEIGGFSSHEVDFGAWWCSEAALKVLGLVDCDIQHAGETSES